MEEEKVNESTSLSISEQKDYPTFVQWFRDYKQYINSRRELLSKRLEKSPYEKHAYHNQRARERYNSDPEYRRKVLEYNKRWCESHRKK